MRPRRLEADSDSGAVLISVLGVSAVILIVASLVASSAIAASTYSSTTRAAMQARAAADAGIDSVWTKLQSGQFLCSFDYTSTNLSYSTDMEYYDENGPLTCTGTQTLSGTPVRALVSSTGHAASKGVHDTGDNRTILALFDIEINDNKVALDKALFTDGGFAITNNVDIVDSTGSNAANVYSNGDVSCHAQNYIQGNAYIQGNFSVNNNCKISGTVWAGGSVTASTQLLVNGDLISAGGTGVGSPTQVDLAQTWVGGSVVANGNITSSNTTNKAYCSIAGYQAKVCGSMVSIEGSITMSNGSNVAGNVYAKNAVDLGTTNSNLIVGGNVISNSAGLLANNASGSGLRVGGYVAVKGSSQVTKTHIGNTVGSCATGTTGLVACNPASPVIPLSNLPAQLNFPTNTRVVAPPRESLPRINISELSTAWVGWTVENVTCANLDTRIAAGWTGKLLLNITGCTSPISWGNRSTTISGDLALVSAAGWDWSTLKLFSNNTTKRVFMLIVPSDGLLANGTTPLVTWTQPISTDLNYYKPTCAGTGGYGNLVGNKLEQTNINVFLYTPCTFQVQNEMKTFTGQIYSGTSIYPNTAVFTYTPIDVPGAVEAVVTPGPAVIVTQTSRFDARD